MATTKPRFTDYDDSRVLSDRHRAWGTSCYAVDIDFLLVEYSGRGEPAALVEYKHTGARIDLTSSNMRAISTLANNSYIPAFVAVYDKSDWSITTYPINTYAEQYMYAGQSLTEYKYVCMLYQMRGQTLDEETASNLHGYDPVACLGV